MPEYNGGMEKEYVNPYCLTEDHWLNHMEHDSCAPFDPTEGNGPITSIAKHPLIRAAISETLKGNTNKTGKKVNVTVEAAAIWTSNLPEENAMSNPVHVEKVRQYALKKTPCPNCGRMMNPGNLARHSKKCINRGKNSKVG
jgi:hypothetical protein